MGRGIFGVVGDCLTCGIGDATRWRFVGGWQSGQSEQYDASLAQGEIGRNPELGDAGRGRGLMIRGIS